MQGTGGHPRTAGCGPRPTRRGGAVEPRRAAAGGWRGQGAVASIPVERVGSDGVARAYWANRRLSTVFLSCSSKFSIIS